MIVVNMKCHLCRCALKNSCFLRHKLWHGALSLCWRGVYDFLLVSLPLPDRGSLSHAHTLTHTHIFTHSKIKKAWSTEWEVQDFITRTEEQFWTTYFHSFILVIVCINLIADIWPHETFQSVCWKPLLWFTALALTPWTTVVCSMWRRQHHLCVVCTLFYCTKNYCLSQSSTTYPTNNTIFFFIWRLFSDVTMF